MLQLNVEHGGLADGAGDLVLAALGAQPGSGLQQAVERGAEALGLALGAAPAGLLDREGGLVGEALGDDRRLLVRRVDPVAPAEGQHVGDA